MNNGRIGFDRELSLDWLDFTASLAMERSDIQHIRRELTARLADQIPGAQACRKTVTVLTRIWVRVPNNDQPLQAEALGLLPSVLPQERLWLHWGMCLLAYPFFRDVAAIVGRLLALQGEYDSGQVRRRIRESWGQRTTVERVSNRVLQTFVEWEVVKTLPPAGHRYTSVSVRQTSHSGLAQWFLECLTRSLLVEHNSQQAESRSRSATLGQNAGQYPLAELVRSPAAFPFDLTPHVTTLRRSGRFEIGRQGMDLEMVALRVQ
jgi:hypothetical protein